MIIVLSGFFSAIIVKFELNFPSLSLLDRRFPKFQFLKCLGFSEFEIYTFCFVICLEIFMRLLWYSECICIFLVQN